MVTYGLTVKVQINNQFEAHIFTYPYNCNFMQLHWKLMTSGLLFVRTEENGFALSFKTSPQIYKDVL